MTYWNTYEIVKHVEHTNLNTETKVREAGGDCDTEVVVAWSTDREVEDHIFIRGFNVEKWFEAGDSRRNCEVEMVEVCDGKDSSGGLYSSDEATCVLYGVIVSRLRKAGFDVVPRLENYL